MWLAWCCHQLGKPTAISWPAVYSNSVRSEEARLEVLDHFESLGAATAASPEAGVDVGEGVLRSIQLDLRWPGSLRLVNPTSWPRNRGTGTSSFVLMARCLALLWHTSSERGD